MLLGHLLILICLRCFQTLAQTVLGGEAGLSFGPVMSGVVEQGTEWTGSGFSSSILPSMLSATDTADIPGLSSNLSPVSVSESSGNEFMTEFMVPPATTDQQTFSSGLTNFGGFENVQQSFGAPQSGFGTPRGSVNLQFGQPVEQFGQTVEQSTLMGQTVEQFGQTVEQVGQIAEQSTLFGQTAGQFGQTVGQFGQRVNQPTGLEMTNQVPLNPPPSPSESNMTFQSAFPGLDAVTVPDYGNDSWFTFLKAVLDRSIPNPPSLTRNTAPIAEPVPRRTSDLPRGSSPIYLISARGGPAYVPFILPEQNHPIYVPFSRETRELMYPYLPLYIPYPDAGINTADMSRRFVAYIPFQPDRFRNSREGAPLTLPSDVFSR
ncbi:hypothetical protein FSP39_019765 [Pinctada imbricata]|uniref:Uncharacterized protein n=1 Tax=Pinctada imbricata TaxID=66713 RepID=A0AA89BUL8_PINIB|nr:hypothetical protein FSP39_019765 [Pinctada imbricata]